MKSINKTYFFLWDDGDTPLLTVEDKELALLLLWYEYHNLPEGPYDLHIKDPVPEDFKISDFYFLAGKRQVFSERIKNAIESAHPANVGFLPAVVHFQHDFAANFFIINPDNKIECMDLAKSRWKKSYHPRGGVLSIDRLVLDARKLEKIPLEQRLVVVLDECETYTLYHESVIAEIAKIEPPGIYPVSVDVWDADMMV